MKIKVSSLFSGIGGLEYGFHAMGCETVLFCENDAAAQAVLRRRFPGVRLQEDVRELQRLPKSDLLAAGFPCQDLSQAGAKKGIKGHRSGLVVHLFRLIEASRPRPNWLLIENVPYMLSLGNGAAMRFLVTNIERLGYRWAYRTIDARSFGVPQRRPRVVFLASRTDDPRDVLLGRDDCVQSSDGKPADVNENLAYGFYWTEGSRGVGWTREGVPPIKGGSTIGIPSPPAVWVPRRDFVGTISIRDAERLQGFPSDWTLLNGDAPPKSKSYRWRLVGNAVNAMVSQWLATQLASPARYDSSNDALWRHGRWPAAAWGEDRRIFISRASTCPAKSGRQRLRAFLQDPLKPLSKRATLGFLSRARICTNVVYSERFLTSLETHACNQ
jgi:DNA (cytosine-5)-methyltransferase 1